MPSEAGVLTRRALSAALVGFAAFPLNGCDGTVTNRFKLSLTVDTPDGARTGFSVIEMASSAVSMPASGVVSKLRGEALYLDLGPGRRPLIALLTSRMGVPWNKMPPRTYWLADMGPKPDYLLELYGQTVAPAESALDMTKRLKALRGPREIEPEALPDLVTFEDVREPSSVIAVDPLKLAKTIGDGVAWRRLTLEMTDEPVTHGIAGRLPWLQKLPCALDGQCIAHADGPLANQLTRYHFIMGS